MRGAIVEAGIVVAVLVGLFLVLLAVLVVLVVFGLDVARELVPELARMLGETFVALLAVLGVGRVAGSRARRKPRDGDGTSGGASQ